MKSMTMGLLAATLTACATGYQPTYYFNEVQVVNLSGAPIRDVDWQVVGSNRSQRCDEVAMYAMCHDRFGKRRYPQQGIELGWTGADGERRSETPAPHVPAFFSTAFALRIVLEIDPDGRVKAFYEQDEPGRGSLFDI